MKVTGTKGGKPTVATTRKAAGKRPGPTGQKGVVQTRGAAKRRTRRTKYDDSLFYPLEGKPKKVPFATWDLESKDGASRTAKGFTRPFMAGFYDGRSFNPFYDNDPNAHSWENRWWKPGGCVDQLMRHMLQKRYSGWHLYAHNGGSFDFYFVMCWLCRHRFALGLNVVPIAISTSSLLAVKITDPVRKLTWTLVDSIKTINMGLDKAGRAFEVGGKYLDDDGERILDEHGDEFTLDAHEFDPGWTAYNRQDCILLYQVMKKAQRLVMEQFGGELGMTVPSTAMRTFRRTELSSPFGRGVDAHQFVRLGYFGGRTEVFDEHGSGLYYVDINSSYPWSMTLDLPYGEPTKFDARRPPEAYFKERIGFCELTVRVPKDIAYPPLPVRGQEKFFPEWSGVDGKLVFPVGILKGVWEWSEVQNAIDCGCEVLQWHQSWWFDKRPWMAGFMDVLYRYRKKTECHTCSGQLDESFYCSTCKKQGFDEALSQWAKLMMNALYGKFAEKSMKTAVYMTSPGSVIPDGAEPMHPTDPDCQVWMYQEERDQAHIMPQISARITATSRVKLHQYAMAASKLVVRECLKCQSKATFTGGKTKKGWQLGKCHGGSGQHGDRESELSMIDNRCAQCPCGGELETRHGRVYYMDTDSLMTDVILPTGGALGQLKDEVPRFSGFLEGRFLAPKVYRLMPEPLWHMMPLSLRVKMARRDGEYCRDVKKRALTDKEFGITLEQAVEKDGSGWSVAKAKGTSGKNRTVENIDKLGDGAKLRRQWEEDNPATGRAAPKMPPQVQAAGTIYDERLEKLGTLVSQVQVDSKGEPVLKKGPDGTFHVQSAPFFRGPRVIVVPRRLHLKGCKRRHDKLGNTHPHQVDMTAADPPWWVRKEAQRAARELKAQARASERRHAGDAGRRKKVG